MCILGVNNYPKVISLVCMKTGLLWFFVSIFKFLAVKIVNRLFGVKLITFIIMQHYSLFAFKQVIHTAKC